MMWIFFSVVALWGISFWRILKSSSFVPAAPSFLTKSGGHSKRKINVLLVIAHPDDESMFFAPTILYLTSKGHNLHVLCISTGNLEGKGKIRMEELHRACVILKVPVQHIKILDHPNLQDGFDKVWDHRLLATIVEEEIKMRGIDLILTFDSYGVSGHPNHRDVRHGVCMFLRENPERSIEAWELISTNIIRKYIGPVDIWFSTLSSLSCLSTSSIYCVTNDHPLKCYRAMAEHSSQWLWFRKLFVLLSRYTYINTLRKIS